MVCARPPDAEAARRALAGAFLMREGGRLKPGLQPPDALAIAEAPLAVFEATLLEGDVQAARLALARAYAGRPVDWALRASDAAAKRVLLCDLDSTIIGCECVDELAAEAGVGAQVAAITEAAMAGRLVFEDALVARVRLLRGLPLAALERVWRDKVRLNPGARTLVATMAARGGRAALVSGGFDFFTARVAADAGFDAQFANRLLDDGAALTGGLAEPILGRAGKRAALLRFCAELSASPEEAVAVGDGANDVDMVAAAGLGVAYRAKPALEAVAAGRIATGDLRAALYFQGVAPGEIIEAG